MPLKHSVLSPGSKPSVPIGNYRDFELQNRICIFSGVTSWVNRLLFVISVASFSQGGMERSGVCHCVLSNSLIQEAEAVTSDPKCVKINSLFMQDTNSCMDMVKGSLCVSIPT